MWGLLLAATLSAAPPTALAHPQGLDPVAPPQNEIGEEALRSLATLRDPNADRAIRDAAAEKLISLARRPGVAHALAQILDGDHPQEVRAPLLRALARTWNPPDRLFTPLVELAKRSDANRAPAVLPAIGAYGTRDAAEALIHFLEPTHPTSLRDAAAAALIRMTGRDELRADATAWRNWLEDARGLSDREWRDLLAEGVWRRSDRLEADRRAISERLSEGFRRLYLATSTDERPRLLAQMMLDPRPEVRDVGLEIVSRELAGGKSMDTPVLEAAIHLLQSTSPRTRAQAAAVIAQIGTPTAAPALIDALRVETSPEAAAAMLQGIARAPSREATTPVIRWLKVSETRTQAMDAALALHRAGYLTEDDERDVLLQAMRATEPAQLSGSAVRLLAFIGNDGDRQRLAHLLLSGNGSTRVAAAEVLAEFPEHVDVILQVAQRDTALFPAAVRAVSSWRNTIAGLEAIASLAARSEEEHREGFLRVSAALPVVDLYAVSSSLAEDLALRESLLARVLDLPMGPFLPGDEEDFDALGKCILLLAETRLALNRPDRALDALQQLPPTWDGATSPRARRLRVIALLWTNRISAAAELDAPASVWLDALEFAIEEGHADAILHAIRSRWSERLTEDERTRLNSLAQRLESAREEAPAQRQEDPPPPQ